MIVLAVDPGETSGWVKADVELVIHKEDRGDNVAYQEPTVELTILQCGTWKGIEDLDAHTRDPHYLFRYAEFVVCEQYIIYPNRAMSHTGSKVYTAREIGRVEWLAFKCGAEMVFQNASQAKQLWPFPRIVNYLGDLPEEHCLADQVDKHVEDALRHLFTWAENRFCKNTNRRLVVL